MAYDGKYSNKGRDGEPDHRKLALMTFQTIVDDATWCEKSTKHLNMHIAISIRLVITLSCGIVSTIQDNR